MWVPGGREPVPLQGLVSERATRLAICMICFLELTSRPNRIKVHCSTNNILLQVKDIILACRSRLGIIATCSLFVCSMSNPDRRPVQTRQVLDAVRRRILHGELPSNAKVNIAALATELQISAGAVREALAMLEAEAFVVFEPMKGYRVREISHVDLRHLLAARIDIENLCLADAIVHGDDAWEASIVAANHRLKRLEERDGVELDALEEWGEAHRAFHAAAVSACTNSWLLRLHDMLYTQSERYRYLSVRLQGVKRDGGMEHGQLVDALLARDVQSSQALMRAHLTRTATLLLEAPGSLSQTGSQAKG